MVELIDLFRFLLLVVFTEAVTEILVAAKITDGFRAFVFRRALPEVPEGHHETKTLPVGSRYWRFINDLLSCGYCTSVWVSMGAALFAPWWLATGYWCGWVINWLVMVFVLHRCSNFLHVGFSLIKKGRVKTYDIEIVHKHQVTIDGSIRQVGSQESSSSGPS